MPETTLSKLRANLKTYCDRTASTRKPLQVKRRDGRDVVLVAADEFDRLTETAYLLSSPRNAARLLEALASARSAKTAPMTMEELREAVGL